MATKMNALSPYLVYWANTNLTRVDIDIYIYSGTQTTDRPAEATYSLTADAYNAEVTFDLSVLVADYFTNSFDGDYSSETLWVDYELTEWISNSEQTAEAFVQLIAFYGYGYFDEGANPSLPSPILICASSIYTHTGNEVVLPISSGSANGFSFWSEGSLVYTASITEATETSEYIKYITPSLEFRCGEDGGTYEGSSCLDALELSYPSGVDSIDVTDSSDNVSTISVNYVDECKYTPYKLTFLNRRGAKQDVWFFKRSDRELLIPEREGFRRNTSSSGSYSINEHQYKNFRINAREDVELNTGFYKEEHNCTFEELMMAEDVWINWESKTLPINIKESSFKYKTVLNDQLIQYKIKFEFAFDKINSVR